MWNGYSSTASERLSSNTSYARLCASLGAAFLFMTDSLSLVDDGALFLDGDAFDRPLDSYSTSSLPHLQPRSMSGDAAGVRRLLPQSSQPQTFTFAPGNFGPREAQKSTS